MIAAFLREVQQQITSKEARGYVAEEIEQHLSRSKASYMEQGETEEVAEQKAVRDMGSSMQLGRKMNTLHKPKVDWLLLGLVMLALGLGFLPLIVAGQSGLYVDKLIHIGLAVAIIAALYFIDYRVIWQWRWMLFVIVLVSYMLFATFDDSLFGDYSTLIIGSFHVTNEIFMAFFIISWASVLSFKVAPISRVIVCFVVTSVFISFETGTFVVIGYMLITWLMIVISHHSLKEKLAVSFTAVVCIVYVIYSVSFIYRARLEALLQPERYREGAGYMTLLIEDVRAAAGMFGTSEPIDIPNNISDFALVNVLQHVGYSGIIVIGVVLGALLLKLLWNARTIKQPFGRLLVQGAAFYYGIHLLFSLLALFGFTLFFNMYTPFLSFGFESLFVNAVLIGLVLSVYRRKSFEERMKPLVEKGITVEIDAEIPPPTTRFGKFLHLFFYIEDEK